MPDFEPHRFIADAEPIIHDAADNIWAPVLRHECTFDSEIYCLVVGNFVRNPNLNSKWLFRAEILREDDVPPGHSPPENASVPCRPLEFKGFQRERITVRKLIPRNTKRDAPLVQTCVLLSARHADGRARWLLAYIPHVSTQEELPFYHPKVRGVALLHEWDPSSGQGSVSLHYWHFDDKDPSQGEKLGRTALMMLSQLHKHGQGVAAGYVKRVHHDTIIPQAKFQDTYTQLKNKYARNLTDSWAEQTDPGKHVFEDLGIAAFLVELWADMYRDMPFPGFVDIGCGNGLLVYILRKEGYSGWGFDARARKSWASYNLPLEPSPSAPSTGTRSTDSLQTRVLLPSCVSRSEAVATEEDVSRDFIHDGVFPKGTFIISNHADELTPWTPILAAQSECPFIAIPCCSHDLTGVKFRAPAPPDPSKGKSKYAGLVAWVSRIARDCGFEVETEMLRIPSTRNTALLGRKWSAPKDVDMDMGSIIAKYGSANGYCENVFKLLKSGPRAH